MKNCRRPYDISHVQDTLKSCRAKIGKETLKHHYQNEVQLMRFALTGDCKYEFDFAKVKPEDESLLSDLITLNVKFIQSNAPFQDRKKKCREFVLQTLAKAQPSI
jgi:hypothetical protein